VQKQIELTSTIETILREATCAGVSTDETHELRAMLDAFNTHVSVLIRKLATRHENNNE